LLTIGNEDGCGIGTGESHLHLLRYRARFIVTLARG
jgi:hypothetical protein